MSDVRHRQVGHGTIGLREFELCSLATSKNYQWGYGRLLVIGKKENGFANMYNIVEIRNFKPTFSE